MSKKIDKPKMSLMDASEFNRIANAYNAQIDQTESPEDFDRVPCIRIMADGTIQLYNCKTGEVIK